MTIGVAWIARRSDGREDLYLASDSRTRGGRVFDLAPKLLPLPRSDAALCFSGDSAVGYPLMLQIAAAIAAHEPARDRNLDIGELLKHLLRVLTDTAAGIWNNEHFPFDKHDPEFILAGYSWRKKDFCIWTIAYDLKNREFRSRESVSFHPLLRKAAFTGDWARKYRVLLTKALDERKDRDSDHRAHMTPMRVLAQLLLESKADDSIGGVPQMLRIGPHMNTRPLAIIWGAEGYRYLYGRRLLDYENCDYWALNPITGQTCPPKHFVLASPDDANEGPIGSRGNLGSNPG
jgi:hypothetical protein